MTTHVLLPQLQLFAISVLTVFLAWVVKLVRARQLSLRDSLLWFLSTLGALVVTVFPRTLYWLTDALGIQVPSNAVFALAFVYVLLNLLSGTIAVSNNAERVRRLTQECALLRAELAGLRARVEERDGPPATSPRTPSKTRARSA